MAGRLNLPNVCDDDPLGMSCKAERILDSPDSGLPPSPGPSAWLQPACGEKGAISLVSEDERRGSSSGPILPIGSVPQLHSLSREGIARAPLPPKELRYTSAVRYDSKRHFIQRVDLQPCGLGVDRCSQTVVALPYSTWRHYKTQLHLQPRLRAQRFQTTTIVYPKHALNVYTTELSYDSCQVARRFLSSVKLEATSRRRLPQCGVAT